MRTSHRVLLVMLSIAGLPAAAEEPAWLREARAREGVLVDPQPFRSKDGWLEGRVVARVAGEIVADEGSYAIDLDIGTETPIGCEVLKESLDLAALLRSVSDNTFPELEAAQGTIQRRAVERIDAGVLGGHGFVAIDWTYLVGETGKALVGQLKQMAVEHNGHTIYCRHTELGYARTFRDVVGSLVESLRTTDAEAAPDFKDVSIAKIADRPIGVVITTLRHDADGDIRTQISASLVVPAAADVLRTQDSVQVQWVHPDGSWINGVSAQSTNGELDIDLKLIPVDDGSWWLKGDFKGKPLDQSFGPRAPDSWLAQARQRRSLLQGQAPVGQELKTQQWIVSADPTRLLEATLRIDARLDADRYAATESVATMAMELVLEAASGSMLEGRLSIGPQVMQFERVHVQGSY